ncbi:reverse transcriptase domain-containing protein [Xenorhabdus budapestensis]|uniref:Group II intron reverse transcriptase/maturase n=1 Tax=Xenorhabdus budapestensis TaxID=290110 RepID=A0A2D0IR03_XENBU|nr:reverse transcriptase domain-containing protein [Xenorhabdus budapestensis]PHM24327.1 group II intron reverse transcriptase/maturase [Xenorhabdus budapestensis]
MLPDELEKRLEGIEDASRKGYPIRHLYKIACEPGMWLQAYVNIRANAGALTTGVSKDTLDGFSLERAETLAKTLRNREYVAKPVRRVMIPKKDGKTRPLGIPSGNDKLAQEVARIILERVYEPVSSEHSHGFRPERSCETALKSIRPTWNGVKWIVDVDIKGFFDNIPHKLLLETLKEKVADKNFLKLIEQWLKAGYVDKWKYNCTYSGTPQGGIISPLLANIYLNKLDCFVERNLIPAYTIGTRRKANPDMNRLAHKIHKLRKNVDNMATDSNSEKEKDVIKREIDRLLEEKRSIPSQVTNDPNFKRMYYVRYADDFVIGIIGSKEDAEHIAVQVKNFISTSLGLEVNEAKTKIRHIEEGVTFLGYEIRQQDAKKLVKQKSQGRYSLRRSTKSIVQLFVPDDIAAKFCHRRLYGRYEGVKATHRKSLINLSEAEIVLTFNAEMRGLANYYSLALDMKYKFSKLYFIWQTSLLKTLANKRRSSVNKVAKKLRQPNSDLVLIVQEKKEIRKIEVFKLKHVNRVQVKISDAESVTARITTRTSEIMRRLGARTCEYCGSVGPCEVHHVKKLKDLKKGRKAGYQPSLWQLMMIARRRKTLILCISCHDKLHSGKLPDLRQEKGRSTFPILARNQALPT